MLRFGLNLLRRHRVAVSVLAVLGFAVLFFRKDIGTIYVKWRIVEARTPAEELAAYRLANTSAHRWAHGYAIEAADESGIDVRPHVTGDYERVAFVRLTWSNGATVHRRLMNRDSLSYIYGE